MTCEEEEKPRRERHGNPWQTSNVQLEGFPTYTLRRRGKEAEQQSELLSCGKLMRWLEENTSTSDPKPRLTGRFALASLLDKLE